MERQCGFPDFLQENTRNWIREKSSRMKEYEENFVAHSSSSSNYFLSNSILKLFFKKVINIRL